MADPTDRLEQAARAAHDEAVRLNPPAPGCEVPYEEQNDARKIACRSVARAVLEQVSAWMEDLEIVHTNNIFRRDFGLDPEQDKT